MGHFLMYAVLTALALFVASTYVLFEHGGGSIAQVREASIHDISTQPNVYRWQEVTTRGTMRYNEDLGLYELLDDQQGANYALVIRKYHTEDRLPALVGQQLIVTGRFDYNDDLGIFIDADTIGLTVDAQ